MTHAMKNTSRRERSRGPVSASLFEPKAWLLIVAALIGMPGPLMAQTAAADKSAPADKVVVRVNGVDIRESDIAMADRDIGAGLPANDPQKKRDYLINYLSDMVMLVQQAEKQKLAGDPELSRRIVFEQNKVQMEAMLARRGQAAISEPALREAYQEALSRAAKEIEYRVRDIQFIPVPSDKEPNAAAEEKAKAALKRLQAGEEFARVADESTDSPTKKGGDLGYLTKAQMSEAFFAAVSAIESGKIAGPFKTESGWHIVLLEDKRPRKIPGFDVQEVRGELEAYVYRKAQHDFIAKLRSEAKIEHIQ
jgi:peptidyl-prolyl cis-trans isomerase C